jgi:5'-nucleotidase
MIWWDVRTSVDWLHVYGDVKEKTVKNLERYVVKDPILPLCIHKLRSSGMKTFIATNSDYRYTQTIMTHLFDYPEGPDGGPHRSWREYFDYVIVDAKKPRFFEEGSMLREVDEDTTSLKLGVFTGALKPGRVYSGGSSGAFCKYSGAKGKEILYVGDHIFGDVIKAKKEQAWRTFLVLPELKKEVKVWESTQSLFLRLQNLSYILAEVYGSGSGPTDGGVKLPDMNSLRRALKITSQEMEDSYPSRLGSLLRCGSRLTHFAIMASRFADLYSSSCVNLMRYPSNYLFTAPHQLMVHETNPSDTLPISPALPGTPGLTGKRPRILSKLPRGMSIVDHDVDLEDDNGIRKRSSHDEAP